MLPPNLIMIIAEEISGNEPLVWKCIFFNEYFLNGVLPAKAMRKQTIDVSSTPNGIWLTSDMLWHLKDVQPIGQVSNTRIRYVYHVLASTRKCESWKFSGRELQNCMLESGLALCSGSPENTEIHYFLPFVSKSPQMISVRRLSSWRPRCLISFCHWDGWRERPQVLIWLITRQIKPRIFEGPMEIC